MQNSRLIVPLFTALLLFLTLLGLAVFMILQLSEGTFVYALDDPYIHLSLARRLAHGEYGINPGEFCAPASSLLYPALLIPFAEWVGGPLLLNILAGMVCLSLLGRMFDSVGLSVRMQMGALALAIFAFNLVGQALEGMEHLVQLALTLLALWGVWRAERENKLPRWLCFALLLGPLVRYENLAMTGLGVLYLLWRRRWGAAGLVLGGLIVLLGGFSVFLKSRGLGFLPTSIEAKAGFHGGPLGNLTYNLLLSEGRFVLGIGLVAVAVGLWQWRRGGWFCLAGGLVAVAQLAGGSVGFGRYEVYALASALVPTALILTQARRWRGAIALLLTSGLVYGSQTLAAVDAASGIYEQQWQMARFVRDYAKQPVAVNDIGLVRYAGGAYVLDLYGLACREALLKNRTQKNHDWMEPLAERHGVGLVMIYEWLMLKDIPQGWTKVGELYLSQPAPYLGGNVVSFYATQPEKAPRLRELLRTFRTTLPRRITLLLAGESLPNETPSSS